MTTRASYNPVTEKASGSVGTTEGTALVLGLGAIIVFALYEGSKLIGKAEDTAANIVGGAGAVAANAIGGAGALFSDTAHGAGHDLQNVLAPTTQGLGSSGGAIAGAPGWLITGTEQNLAALWGGAGALFNRATGLNAPDTTNRPLAIHVTTRAEGDRAIKDWRTSPDNPYRGSV